MRMWMVSPQLLCQQHLLGEHLELHMFVGTIKKGMSLDGYVANGLVETKSIQSRHDALVEEMLRRGLNHASPLDYHDTLNLGTINPIDSLTELRKRCPKCKDLQEEYVKNV